MKSPIPWIGGKYYLRAYISELLPPHRLYCEPFGGAMSVLLHKKPSPAEVYNDINSDLVHYFRTLRNPDTFEEFKRRIALVPFSREELELAKIALPEDPIERAVMFYFRCIGSFSGRRHGGWAFHRTSAGQAGTWANALEGIDPLHKRLAKVMIEHDTGVNVIRRFDSAESLFYLDPPYPHSTRTASDDYEFEMSEEDHKELIDTILTISGLAIISGYDNPLYRTLEEHGWKRRERATVASSAGATRGTKFKGIGARSAGAKRLEVLWLSPRVEVPQRSLEELIETEELDPCGR